MTLGEKLSKLRKEYNYTQEQLADILGVSRQSISKWESDIAYPETDKLVKMGKLFECSMDYLLNEDDDAFAEYLEQRERQRTAPNTAINEKRTTDAKADYEQKKQQNAERRKNERKIERATAKIAELEAEIAELDEELFGEAATDYVRAAEIDKRKNEIEEELLSLYEIVM